MNLNPETKAVIRAFAAKYPLPLTNDEDAANWTHKLCEQLRFTFSAWGHKSAGPGRPHSADCIALSSPFIGWDIVTNAGSPAAQLNVNADSQDLTGQIFEPVTATDHLGAAPEIPSVPEVPPTVPNNDTILLMQILAELKTQTEIFKLVAAGLAQLPAQINETFSKGVKIRF